MSSILTNMAAMSAVQNLAATQRSLASTQNEISTGLSVSSAQDNAAYYSIAQTMRTSVSNISAVSSSLNLGASVVSTASAATGQITSILQSISADLVTAKSNVGNTSTLSYLNTAISSLNQQLGSIVSAASFNGTNLLDGSQGASVNFVSGITGSGANTAVSSLTVNTTSTNLGGSLYTPTTNTLVDTAVTAYKNNSVAQAALVTDQTANSAAISTLSSDISNLTAADLGNGSAVAAGAGSAAFQAVFGANAAVAASTGVITGISATSPAGLLIGTGTGASVTVNATAPALSGYTNGTAPSGGTLSALYGTTASSSNTSQATGGQTAVAAGTASILTTAQINVNNNAAASQIYNGALFQVGQISVGPNTTAAQIDGFIKTVGAAVTAVNQAAEQLGAASSQISLQSTYISSLSSSLTAGVGSLVDADMNEASTRLSALQTQQQLGVQALSVANQSSQLILKLFQ